VALDPVKLQRVLHWIGQQRARGRSSEDIDAELARNGHKYTSAQYVQLAGMPEAQPTTSSLPRDMGRAALALGQGATGGWLDELTGMLAAGASGQTMLGPSGPAYRAARDAVRRENAAFKAEHSVASPALNILGSALPLSRVTALSKAGLAAKTGAGAGLGAFMGAGDAPEMSDVPEYAARGGIIGGLLTPPIEGLAHLGGIATGGLYNLWNGLNPDRAARVMGQRLLRNLARETGTAPEAVAAKLGQLESVRPGLSVPADASEQLQDALRSSINQGHGRVDDVLNFLRQRAAGARDRLATDLQETGGADINAGAPSVRTQPGVVPNPASVPQQVAQLQAQVGARVYSPYEAATANGMPVTDEMRQLLQNPDIRAAWAKVRPLTGKSGVDAVSQIIEQGIPADRAQQLAASKGIAQPTFNHFNALLRQLRGNAQEALAKNNGAEAHRLFDLSDKVQGAMERTPGMTGLADANREYAQASSVGRAFDLGQKNASARSVAQITTRDLQQVASDAGPYAPQATDAYRKGVMSRTLEDLLRTGESGNVAERFRAIAGNLFPNVDAFQRWLQGALADGTFYNTVAGATANSTTAKQLLGAARLAGGGTSPTVGERLIIGPRGVYPAIVARFRNAVGNQQLAAKTAENFRALLATPGRSNREAFLKVLSADQPLFSDASVQDALQTAPTTAGLAGAGNIASSPVAQDVTSRAMAALSSLLSRPAASDQLPQGAPAGP
jgi:hypothetical protein